MHIDLFTIGNFTVHTYGFSNAVGIVLAVIIGLLRAKRVGLTADEVINIALIAVILGFVGAKILFVLENWQEFLEHPWSVLGSSGFVVYGGLVIGICCVFIYCYWIRKISFLRYMDLIFPCVILAQAFGRLGCFMAGCCYGKETTAWWGVVFPENSMAPAGVPLIPTQLISAIGDFVILLVLIWFSRKAAKKAGDVLALYLLLYGAGRFCIEFFRQNEQGGIGPVTTAQCFSIVFMAAAVVLFILNRRAKYSQDYAEIFAEMHEKEQESAESGDESTGGSEESTGGCGESVKKEEEPDQTEEAQADSEESESEE